MKQQLILPHAFLQPLLPLPFVALRVPIVVILVIFIGPPEALPDWHKSSVRPQAQDCDRALQQLPRLLLSMPRTLLCSYHLVQMVHLPFLACFEERLRKLHLPFQPGAILDQYTCCGHPLAAAARCIL